MMLLYHATSEEGFKGITKDGQINADCTGVVYFAETAKDATKFVAFRLFGQPIYVIEVAIPEEEQDKVEESFDHSFNFFQCRAWTYAGDVPSDWFTNAWMFT